MFRLVLALAMATMLAGAVQSACASAVPDPGRTASAVVAVFIDRPTKLGPLLPEIHREITGSGVVVSPEGLILTSTHVVEGGVRPVVRLWDGRRVQAHIVLADKRSDIAVLQITSPVTPLPTLPLSIAPLRIGEDVLALGSSLGGDQQARAGAITSLPQTAAGIADFPPFVETSAAISPGYSGGPLINSQEEIIGIDAAIYAQHGRFEGTSFAVPSSTAARVLARAKALVFPQKPAGLGVEKEHAKLLEGRQPLGGSTVADLSPRLAYAYGLDPAASGVVVSDPGHGYADEAGFEVGDVVLSVNNTTVASVSDLSASLSQSDHWRVTIRRGMVVKVQDFAF